MLKKLSIVLSILAVLVLGLALTMPQPVLAKEHKQQGHQQQMHKQVQKKVVVHKNVQVKKSVHAKKAYVVGKKYGGHIWYGHHRHRWHGTWYEYGVGPCWIEIDGDWFWNELTCP
jgi:Ni/Co efflux regulator RcnB